MSNMENDILREKILEEATEIVQLMIEDKGLNPEVKEETSEEPVKTDVETTTEG